MHSENESYLISTVQSSKRPYYFDFLIDFSKYFKTCFTQEHLAVLFKALVERIMSDLEEPKKTLDVR